MSKIEGGFSLIALLDGTTINGTLRVFGAPFVQKYVPGTTNFTPNFADMSMSVNDRPTAVLMLRNLANGALMTPRDYTWYYNGVAMEFALVEDEGVFNNKYMCSNITGAEGEYLFESLQYAYTIGTDTYYFPAIRVWGNLVPLSDANNDLLSVSGEVELNGQRIAFNDINLTIVIQEASGNKFDVTLTDNLGGAFTERSEEMTITCSLYNEGSRVEDLAGYTFKWYKMLGTGDEEITGDKVNSNTLKLTIDDIDSLLKVRCDVYQKSNNSFVAGGVLQVADNTDEYYVDFTITGITGNSIRTGETANITPVMRKRRDGSNVELVSSWTFSLYKNDGTLYKTESEVQSISLSYAQVMSDCGGGMSGVVSGNY